MPAQKTISQLDDAGHFVGAAVADESPLEPGVWLIPAGAIDAPPPEIPDGSLARWDGDGFVIEAIPAPEVVSPSAPSSAELQAKYTALLDARIDSEAKSHGYDNRVTCSMRAGYAGPYQAECLAFALWMDACYESGQQVLADVTAGARPMPTPEAFLAELPPMVWPGDVQ